MVKLITTSMATRKAVLPHLLTKFMNEAFKSTDRNNATTAVTIDYSKAFDYVDHTILIEKLISLGVRTNLINIIISFHKNRSHCTLLFGKNIPIPLHHMCCTPRHMFRTSAFYHPYKWQYQPSDVQF